MALFAMKKFAMTGMICRQLSDARRKQGMTQSALAAAVGCKQSAISMFESGQTEKIARETVEKMADVLGVALPTDEKAASGLMTTPCVALPRGYCPQAMCPSNVPFEVGGRLLFWPKLQLGKRCAYCGEVLETACPNCGAPLHEGACCTTCGEPLITAEVPAGAEPAAWTAARREEVGAIRELIGEKR